MSSKASDDFEDREDIINDSGEEDEEVQDWSQVSQLVASNTSITLPRRGEKDYEPDGSNIQELQLYRARKLMLDTLRNSVRGSVLKSQVKAYYNSNKHQAFVPFPKGNFMQTMGRANSSGEFWLDFHEFVYLAERGTITPFWGDNITDEHEIPLAIEDLYSLFYDNAELNRYLIFSHLKRLGFIVTLTKDSRCHSTSFFPNHNQDYNIFSLNHIPVIKSIASVFKLKFNLFQNYFAYSTVRYVLGRYTTNEQIYKSIGKLIATSPVPKCTSSLFQDRNENIPFMSQNASNIVFDMWKPQVNFRKKSPGLPDYQIAIFDKNNTRSEFPTYKQLKSTFNELDYKFDFLDIDEADWDKHSYTCGVKRSDYLAKLRNKSTKIGAINRPKKVSVSNKKTKRPSNVNALKMKKLKQGYRSFLMAIVDNGLISFVRISETDFTV